MIFKKKYQSQKNENNVNMQDINGRYGEDTSRAARGGAGSFKR